MNFKLLSNMCLVAFVCTLVETAFQWRFYLFFSQYIGTSSVLGIQNCFMMTDLFGGGRILYRPGGLLFVCA